MHIEMTEHYKHYLMENLNSKPTAAKAKIMLETLRIVARKLNTTIVSYLIRLEINDLGTFTGYRKVSSVHLGVLFLEDSSSDAVMPSKCCHLNCCF